MRAGDDEARSRFRGDVQGLRAVAVLLVVLGHARVPGLAGGYVGVDVFFVISGFLITGVLVREIRRTGRVSIADFYARRARRILPAATVTLVVVVLVSGWLLNHLRASEVLTHAVWAALFGANVYSARQGSDYFAETSFVSPLQHFWTLAVEEQFYLLWPALIAVLLLVGRRPADRPGRLPRRLLVAVIVLSGVSLAWSAWQTWADPSAAFYQTPARGWELGLGAVLALCAHRLGALPPVARAAASWAGLGAIAVAALTFSASTPMPGYHALLPAVGAALVLAGGAHGPSYGARLALDRAPMRWAGDISYSLYLWHWPLLVLPPAYLERDLRPIDRLVLVIAAFVVAALSYRYVETPLRYARALSRHRVRAVLMWPATAATVIGIVVAVQVLSAPPGTAGGPSTGIAAIARDPAGAVGRAADLARAGAPLPRRTLPALTDLRDDVSIPPRRCFAQRPEVEHDICELGDTGADRTVVLFGDSHLAMWIDPIVARAEQAGWRVVPLLKSSCFPADVTVWLDDEQAAYTECDRWRSWAHDELARLKPDAIVTSGRINLLADPATGAPMPLEQSRRAFAAGVASTLRTLRAITPEVYTIGGTPGLSKEAGDCLAARDATRGSCAGGLDQVIAERNHAWRAAAAATGTHFVDVLPWMCQGGTCPLVIEDVIVYRDAHHVTRTFAGAIGVKLVDRLGL